MRIAGLALLASLLVGCGGIATVALDASVDATSEGTFTFDAFVFPDDAAIESDGLTTPPVLCPPTPGRRLAMHLRQRDLRVRPVMVARVQPERALRSRPHVGRRDERIELPRRRGCVSADVRRRARGRNQLSARRLRVPRRALHLPRLLRWAAASGPDPEHVPLLADAERVPHAAPAVGHGVHRGEPEVQLRPRLLRRHRPLLHGWRVAWRPHAALPLTQGDSSTRV